MALEHRDYYREKKPDWDNISFLKKPRFLTPLLFVFFFVLVVAIQYWCDVWRKPVNSPSVSVQSVPQAHRIEQFVIPPVDEFKSPPFHEVKQESLRKESPVVRSIPAGYQGYVEVNGVKKEIYSPAVVSETYRYRSISGVKFLSVKINGVEFDAMIDTGASLVSVGSSVVRSLGVEDFTKKRIMNTAGGNVWVYDFPCSVSLGSFEVSKIQCVYNPYDTYEILLGGSFLENFNYSFNESENTVTFSLR